MHKHRLTIERDDKVHFAEEAQAYDAHRTLILESLGLRLVCFSNDEVIYRFGSVCTQIQAILVLPERSRVRHKVLRSVQGTWQRPFSIALRARDLVVALSR